MRYFELISQFGCFQFTAAHISGEDDPNTILLRVCAGALWYTQRNTESTKSFG